MNNVKNQIEILTRYAKELKLGGFTKGLENQFANEASYSGISFYKRLEELFQREVNVRKERSYQRLLKQGSLKYLLSFEQIRFTALDGVSEEDMQFLMGNSWLYGAKAVNILIMGPCGVGKTSLACCLLNNIAREGDTVKFCRMCDLAVEISTLSGNPVGRKALQDKLAKYKVLAIDDLGSEPLTTEVVSFLYGLIDTRAPVKPTIVTTQLKPSGIITALGNNSQSEAIVDRLMKPCKMITLKGASKRATL